MTIQIMMSASLCVCVWKNWYFSKYISVEKFDSPTLKMTDKVSYFINHLPTLLTTYHYQRQTI